MAKDIQNVIDDKKRLDENVEWPEFLFLYSVKLRYKMFSGHSEFSRRFFLFPKFN